jgi:hypothetical protein
MANRPKLELNPGEEVTVTLLKDKPMVGENGYGPYYLYSLRTLDNTEVSFFSPPEIHQIIEEKRLGKGSQFILRKPAQHNGQKSKLEIALIGNGNGAAKSDDGDDLKQLLLQCIRDAADIVKEAGIQFSNDELQKLATTLFIQRTRLA